MATPATVVGTGTAAATATAAAPTVYDATVSGSAPGELFPIATSLSSVVLRPLEASDRDELVKMANNRKIWLNLRNRFPHPVCKPSP